MIDKFIVSFAWIFSTKQRAFIWFNTTRFWFHCQMLRSIHVTVVTTCNTHSLCDDEFRTGIIVHNSVNILLNKWQYYEWCSLLTHFSFHNYFMQNWNTQYTCSRLHNFFAYASIVLGDGKRTKTDRYQYIFEIIYLFREFCKISLKINKDGSSKLIHIHQTIQNIDNFEIIRSIQLEK